MLRFIFRIDIGRGLRRLQALSLYSLLGIICLVLSGSFPATAQERQTQMFTGNFVVDYHTDDLNLQWIARAMELKTSQDLSVFERLYGVDKASVDTSPCQDLTCVLQAYQDAGIHIYLGGKLSEGSLSYVVFDTTSKIEVSKGELAIGPGSDPVRFRIQMVKSLRDFTRLGGLLDELAAKGQVSPEIGSEGDHELGSEPTDAEPAALAWYQELRQSLRQSMEKHRSTLQVVFAFGFPAAMFLTFLYFGRFQFKRRDQKRQMFFSGLALFGIFLLLVLSGLRQVSWINLPEFDQNLSTWMMALNQAFELTGWLLPIVSGLLWGWLVLQNLKFLFPDIFGFEHIEHQIMPSLLKSWLYVSTLRIVIAIFVYTGLVVIVWMLGIVYEFSLTTLLTIVLPLSALTFWLWLGYILDGLALKLDIDHVSGPAHQSNPWHTSIVRYLDQYQSRNGVKIPEKLLKKILFLPNVDAATITYAGGFSKTRIVIDQNLLHLALGVPYEEPAQVEDQEFVPVDFEEEDPGETNKEDQQVNAKEVLQDARNKKLQTEYMKLQEFQKITTFKPFEVDAEGQTGVGTQRIADPDGELAVTMTPKKNFKLTEEDEHDDANFSMSVESSSDDYRDFLYGLLLSEIGHAHHRNHYLHTLILAFRQIIAQPMHRPARAWHFVSGIYQRYASRYPRLLADLMAPLYRADHHLLQYLHYSRENDEKYLTSNANSKELVANSRQLLEFVASMKQNPEDLFKNHATLNNRMRWLVQHMFALQFGSVRNGRLGVLLRVAAVVLLLSLAADRVLNSVLYHDLYVARIEEQLRDREEKLQDRQELLEARTP